MPPLLDVGTTVTLAGLLWDIIKEIRGQSTRNEPQRSAAQRLLNMALGLRRYARCLEEYADCMVSPGTTIEQESILLLDTLRERLAVADMFGSEAFDLVAFYSDKAKAQTYRLEGWFQLPAFERWEMVAEQYGVNKEHLGILDDVLAANQEYLTKYGDFDEYSDDGPLPLLPKIETDEQLAEQCRKAASAARVLAVTVDEVVREHWTLREALDS